MVNFQEKVNFIWSIAELLRGPYRKEQYGDVVLPMSVIRRFDCVLEPTKKEVLQKFENVKKTIKDSDPILNRITGQDFNNTSKYDFSKLLADPDNIANNLRDYINGFSKNARDIIEHFDFDKQIVKLDTNNLLYLILSKFNEVDFHTGTVSPIEMGYIFEELIRRFSEHGEAGDHYTPREVIQLMVNHLLNDDKNALVQKGLIVTIMDPAAGTGGMLSIAEKHIRELNPDAHVEVFGQEINAYSYAICKAEMLMKGHNANNIVLGDSFTHDGHHDKSFRYMLTNPPFGVEWKKAQGYIQDEHEKKGFKGRFGAGLPRISDGQLLFLQHLISKMKEDEMGSRIAIVFNGSPLFTGDAGSGESEIRRWIIENDMLEGIIALPDQLFYNTGIQTYVWIITNRKNGYLSDGPVRKGKIQLVNAVDFYQKLRKSLGQKRNELSVEHIAELARIYSEFTENEYCKIFDNKDFGYLKITVERPLRLNFMISEERIENLDGVSGFNKLYDEEKANALELEKEKNTLKPNDYKKLEKLKKGQELQARIKIALRKNINNNLYKNREEFAAVLDNVLKGIDVTASLKKAILMGLAERDETADYCCKTGKKKEKEADPELRDTETIPLSVNVENYEVDPKEHIEKEQENIKNYIEIEVKPHVPEFWIDHSKTKIGYEIPFTRHFYKFKPLQPFVEIMDEIRELEKEIAVDLRKVIGYE